MPDSKDVLTVEIDKVRIRASGRFAVAVAAMLALLLIAARWAGFW
jgi:hypothetical protein